MGPTVRIAVLECDKTSGEVKRQYGTFVHIFQDLLREGASRLPECSAHERPELKFLGFDVVRKQEFPDLDHIDAVLLTGSSHDSFQAGDGGWIERLVAFIAHLLNDQDRVRVMGVCFGHQIIGRALGVMPKRSERGWEVAVTPVKLTERGKEVFGKDSLAIHQMHRDVVPTCPSDVELLGSSPQCEVQALFKRRSLLSVQGHPEFSEAIVSEILERRRGTALDEETYQRGQSRSNLEHDGVVVAGAFIRFLLDTL